MSPTKVCTHLNLKYTEKSVAKRRKVRAVAVFDSFRATGSPPLRVATVMPTITTDAEPTRAELQSLYQWAKESSFAGNDPHDLLTSPFLQGLRSPLVRLAAVQLGRRSPINVRRLLRVPRSENAKALALFISGLVRAKERATLSWHDDAEQLVRKLLRLQHANGGWGYPFPWQSRTHYLPTGMPNIVTTSFAGISLADFCAEHPSEEVKNALERAVGYVLHSVSRVTTVPDTGIAFGYAQDDPQIVFNASLLGAEFLLNAGILLGNDEYMSLARQAAQYVACFQASDGSWVYGREVSQTWIDSFHTGFVVVSMRHIAEALRDAELLASATRGFIYFKKTFIAEDFAVNYFSNKRFPIDAHALGQAMVTLATFGDVDTAQRVAAWSIENMRSPKGYFYYQRHRLFTNRIPYLRWSNAWMFRGLAELAAYE